MSISTANRNDYTGNGTTETYSYTFKIFANTDLEVVVTDSSDSSETELSLTTDFTVTGVGEASGGTIVLVNTGAAFLDGSGYLDTGYTLLIRRKRPLTQTTDIRNQGSFYPSVHEDTFDHLVMIDQQQQDEIDRSAKFRAGYTGADPTLPDPEDTKYLRWDGTNLSNETPTVTDATKATQAQAEAGTDNANFMTPLRTQQKLNISSIDELSDVDTTTSAPVAGDILSWDGTKLVPYQPISIVGQSNLLENLGFKVTVASHLTVELKQADGSSDPSTGARQAVRIAFNEPGGSTANYSIATITSALSLTLTSGATLGFADNKEQYVYIYATKYASTIGLAVSSILYDESQYQTITSISAGSDSNLLYGTDNGSSRSIRLIGRFRSTQTTAGTWLSAGYPEAITQGMALVEPEFVTDNSTNVTYPIAADTVGELTSFELTPNADGWDISAQGSFSSQGATTTTFCYFFISAYSGTSVTDKVDGLTAMHTYKTSTAYSHDPVTIMPFNVNPSAATTYYLKAMASNSVTNLKIQWAFRATKVIK